MRKRNPIAYIVLGVGALLAVLLVIASSRRAVQDPVPEAGTGTVATLAGAGTTRAAAGSSTPAKAGSSSTAKVSPTVPKASTTAGTAPKGMASISASALPREGRATLALIESGGPFPYDQDGVVFQNRERILPRKADGYYHEYTVETPGSPDRGARRIIAGQAGERYYTDDHYASFRLVVP